jgi:hypothetical protein
MIDKRVSKLLRKYYKVRNKNNSQAKNILIEKYNLLYMDAKYKYEQLFLLGPDNYENELDSLLTEIEKTELVIIAVLEELIEASS